MRRLLLLLILAVVSASAPAQPPPPADDDWIDVEAANLDLRALTTRGEQVLALKDIPWKHAQTTHFVIHYEQAIFARKVARMAEFFYAYVAQDLQGVKDRVEGRSHIFVFRSGKRWEDFCRLAADVPEWTFSQVAGTVMFLQQADNTSSSGNVLAHEMTHLVMNRFYLGRAPIWLDEGLAEYYGEFGYSEFKGTKKSKRAQFSKLADPYPLRDVLYSTVYPAADWQVQSFYDTSKYLVAFLLLDHPPAKLLPFMEDLMGGADAMAAFSTHYGYASFGDLDKAFRKFAF
jgi:hypothetical protein